MAPALAWDTRPGSIAAPDNRAQNREQEGTPGQQRPWSPEDPGVVWRRGLRGGLLGPGDESQEGICFPKASEPQTVVPEAEQDVPRGAPGFCEAVGPGPASASRVGWQVLTRTSAAVERPPPLQPTAAHTLVGCLPRAPGPRLSPRSRHVGQVPRPSGAQGSAPTT